MQVQPKVEGAEIVKWERMDLSSQNFHELGSKLGPRTKGKLRIHAEKTGDRSVLLTYEYGPCSGKVNVPGIKAVYRANLISIEVDVRAPREAGNNVAKEGELQNVCTTELAVASLVLKTTEPIDEREIKPSLVT